MNTIYKSNSILLYRLWYHIICPTYYYSMYSISICSNLAIIIIKTKKRIEYVMLWYVIIINEKKGLFILLKKIYLYIYIII